MGVHPIGATSVSAGQRANAASASTAIITTRAADDSAILCRPGAGEPDTLVVF